MIPNSILHLGLKLLPAPNLPPSINPNLPQLQLIPPTLPNMQINLPRLQGFGQQFMHMISLAHKVAGYLVFVVVEVLVEVLLAQEDFFVRVLLEAVKDEFVEFLLFGA